MFGAVALIGRGCLALIMLPATLFTVLALLAVEINASWMTSLDASVYNWFHRHRFHQLRIDSSGVFAFIGQPVAFAVAGVISGMLLALQARSVRPAVVVTGGVAVGVVVEETLKAVVTRTPTSLAVLHDGSLLDYAHSFPHGHVTAVGTLLGMIAVRLGTGRSRIARATLAVVVVTAHDVSHHLHQRSVSEIGGAAGKVLADWLLISPAEARRRARVSEPLTERTTLTEERLAPRQPAAADAWRSGALDRAHLRVIQRFLADLPLEVSVAEREKAEAFLAEHARLLRPDQLARLADRLALEINPDGTFSEEDRARKRSFILGRQRPDGMTEARLSATPELRAYLEAWLAKFGAPGMCNPADQTAVVDGEPVPAQVEADTRTVAQRHHDALMALVRSKLGDPKLGQHNGLPVTVIVSATLQELQDRTGYGVTAGGALVPMEDVIRMSSHSYHYLALFDGVTGQALWLGRTKRLASADQRIVLHAAESRPVTANVPLRGGQALSLIYMPSPEVSQMIQVSAEIRGWFAS